MSTEDTVSAETTPEPGSPEKKSPLALCLSGGGFRAMLFHVGALWRINELELLRRIDTISSVSGGSITAGLLACNWSKLQWNGKIAQNYKEAVVKPLLRFANHRIADRANVLFEVLRPRKAAVGAKIADAYDKHLFRGMRLGDLPDRDAPRFVFNATNLQSGVRWRFSKEISGDYRVGYAKTPEVRVADAVAASSAFPPFLAPFLIDLSRYSFKKSASNPSMTDLNHPPYTKQIYLADGGVYDNFGIQAVDRRRRDKDSVDGDHAIILISNGGKKLTAEEKPKRNWFSLLKRAIFLIDNQVRAQRLQRFFEEHGIGEREGAYWGIDTEIEPDDLPVSVKCKWSPEKTEWLANLDTQLSPFGEETHSDLINWGYLASDVMIRKHYLKAAAPAAGLPLMTQRKAER